MPPSRLPSLPDAADAGVAWGEAPPKRRRVRRLLADPAAESAPRCGEAEPPARQRRFSIPIRWRLSAAIAAASAMGFLLVAATVAALCWWRTPEALSEAARTVSQIAPREWAAILSAAWLLTFLCAMRVLSAAAAPIAKLAAAVETAARDPKHKPEMEASGRDEYGKLAEAIDRLLTDIAGRTAALEQQHCQMEQYVASRTEELRQEIAERTRAEVLARRAKEDAEAANAAKDEFLSRMSHELRTPLNAILGFAQLLEMDPLTEEQGSGVSHIIRAGQHLLQLVNEVLDISRISSGQFSLSSEPVMLREVVCEALEMVAQMAQKAQVRLPECASSAAGLDRRVVADRQRLKQVFLNLLTNAVKYNRPDGSVRITAFDSCDRRLRIEVADTGIGIEPEKLKRLFTPFDRLGAEQHGIEGTGIGLALSHQLMQAMGGVLTATSTKDSGTTFAIELPLAEDAGSGSAKEPEATAPTIVFFETSQANSGVVREALAPYANAQMHCPTSVGEALELLAERRADALFLDLQTTDAPPEELIRRMRQAPQTRDTRIVVMGMDATPRQIVGFLQAGANHYLPKPLEPSHVRSLLTGLLQEDPDGRRAISV